MKTIGQRLRDLREPPGQPRVMSQDDLGLKLQRNQRWISERERDIVGTTVEEATEICEALGYAGEFVVLPVEHQHLLRVLAGADPATAALALRLIMALPHLDENSADMVRVVIATAENAAARATGTR